MLLIIIWDRLKNESGQVTYTPNIDVDNYFLRRKDYFLVEEDKDYTVTIEFNCYSVLKYMLVSQISHS